MRGDAHGPVASFVTTAPAGQLVRVQIAPVLGAETGDAAEGAPEGITGFVMLLDNITRRIESGSRRDSLLQTLTQGTRASLASVRAAVETIASFPEMDNDARGRFIAIIGEEATRMSAGLDQAASEFADSLRTEWPLEDIRGADLITAARRRIESRLGIADEARGGRGIHLDEGGQLFADAGHHLHREPAAGGVRHPGGSLRPRAKSASSPIST